MKIILIFFFTTIIMLMINLGIDLIMGSYKTTAINNLFNPFWVMKPFEYLLLIILFVCTLAGPIIYAIRDKYKS